MTISVQFRNLRWYRGDALLLDVPALDLAGPGLVHVSGPSGAGKSSFLKALTGTLEEFQGGRVEGTLEILADAGRKNRIAFVSQDVRDTFLAHDPMTELQLRLQALGVPHKEARTQAAERLTAYGFDELATRPIAQLSAGERKRLAMLAARVQRPSILLLDEPLNHLDAEWRTAILNEIQIAAHEALVVVATHDSEAWTHAATFVRLEGGRAAVGHPVPLEPLPPRGPFPPRGGPRLVAQSLVDSRGVLDGVNLDVANGLHVVTGKNGSGKSTLLRILGGLEEPRLGTVWFDGRDLAPERPSALARFRAYHIEEPAATFFLDEAREEIEFQLRNARVTHEEVKGRVARAAVAMGIEPLLGRHPTSLSGGEQERLALACIQAADGRLIVLDEPTQGLDAAGRRRLCEFLDRARSQACVILATHDPELIARADSLHRLEGKTLRNAPRAEEALVRA